MEQPSRLSTLRCNTHAIMEKLFQLRLTIMKVKVFGPVVAGWCEIMYSPADDCEAGPDMYHPSSYALLL